MVTTTVNTSSDVFNYVTDVSSVQSNTCGFTNQAINTGNSIIINNSTAGNLSLGTKADMNTACILANNQDTSVTNLMETIGTQVAKTNQSIISLQISSEVNSSQVYQNVNNIISQVQSNTCATNQTSILSNNTVVIQNSNVGDLALTAEGSLTGSCTQNNAGKVVVNSSGNTDTNQSASITNILFALIIVIGIVAVVMVIGVIGLIAFGKLGKKQNPSDNLGFLEGLPEVGEGEGEGEGEGGLMANAETIAAVL